MGTAARNAFLELDNSGGTPVDLSTYGAEIDESEEVGLEDTTTFGTAVVAKSNTVTLYEGGFSLRAPWHATLSSHLAGLKGLLATSTFTIGPTGSTGGMEKITGECRLKTLKRTGAVGGALRIEAEFAFDGTLTRTTF